MEYIVSYYAIGWVIVLTMAKFGDEKEISVCDTFMLVWVMPLLLFSSIMAAPIFLVVFVFGWLLKKAARKLKLRMPQKVSCPIIRIRI